MRRHVHSLKYREKSIIPINRHKLEKKLEKLEIKSRLQEKLQIRLLLKEVEKIEIREEKEEINRERRG